MTVPAWRPVIRSYDEAVETARMLLGPGRRHILGIVGPPGAGKSSLAAALVRALAPMAALVPMDGFHLAQSELARLGRADRKGAPDTFDAAGYAALLHRLRTGGEHAVVYAPEYRREIEEGVAGAIPVPAEVCLVVTEGNYLLFDSGEWVGVRNLLDEAWYLSVPDEDRLPRLVARHIAVGKDPAAAHAWAHGPDQANARLVSATALRADRLLSSEVVADVLAREMEDLAP